MQLLPKRKDPRLHQLKQLLREGADAKRRALNVAKSGLNSHNETVAEMRLAKARELMLEYARLTWESVALQMELAGELLASWTQAEYYHAPDLRTWAKVHALSSGRFLLEAVAEDGHGTLAEVATYQRLAAWQPCTAEQYRARLDALLASAAGIQWDTLSTAPPTQG